MVRTGSETRSAIGNLSKRIKRQQTKANKITKQSQKTGRDMRQSHDQSMVLQERLEHQVTRVMHAWKITRKLQIKYHKMKQVKIAKQIYNLKTSGKIVATTRYAQLRAKLEVENHAIAQIQAAFTEPMSF